MSKASNLRIGEKVALLPFRHKGKIGVVKYIGEIEGKTAGNWVGIELEEPVGECDGEFNGAQIFECQPKHGIFLRPTNVKTLEEQPTKMNESSIMKMNESMFSGNEGIGQLIGSTIGTGQDIGQIEKNFSLEGQQEKPTTFNPVQVDDAGDDGAAGGKIKGWKDRIAKLRQQKEQERQQHQEISRIFSVDDQGNSSVGTHTAGTSGDGQTDESIDKIKNIFAPAKGLERGQDGKFQIDKEKVEEKKEIEFEKKTENLVADELKKVAAKSGDSVILKATAEKIDPAKTDRAKADAPKKDLTSLKAPSKLKAPSAATTDPNADKGLLSTQDRKQKLLEKQQAVNAKLAEKAKAESEPQSPSGTKQSKQSNLKERPTIGTAKSRLAAGKIEETKSRLTGSRQSVAAPDPKAVPVRPARLGARRESTLNESDELKVLEATARENKAGTSRLRGTSASKDQGLQFGQRGRQSELGETDPNKPRGSSKTKDLGLQFGQNKRDRSNSKDRIGLKFGQSGTSDQTVKLDPSMTMIKKTEYEELLQTKQEVEKFKEDVYNITIKMKKAENQCEILKRDHKDELEQLENTLMQNHLKQTENLVQKHGEERNRLIEESNRGNDDKLNKALQDLEQLKKQKDELESQLKQQIEELTNQSEEALRNLREESQEQLKETQTALSQKIKELTESNTKASDDFKKADEKNKTLKAKIEKLEETVQEQKIDLEANQLEIEMLKDEKSELLAEMTEQNKVDQEDLLSSLSLDELKQQNRKLRQAVSSLASGFELERAKLTRQIEDEEGKKKIIEEYEKKLQDMDVLLEELDRKEEELAEVKMENEACLEYEQMVEEMAQEIIKKEDEIEDGRKKIKELEDILTIQEGYSEQLEQYNQELAEDLAEKATEVSMIESQREQDEELLLDLEDENQKYREKVQQLQKTIKELTEQLQQHSTDGKEKSRVEILVERQNQLLQLLKESDKKEIDATLVKIDYHWAQTLKGRVVEAIIPQRLKETVHFDSLSKFATLTQTSNKALLLLRFICEKQLPNVSNMFTSGNISAKDAPSDEAKLEELENQMHFIRVLIAICEQTTQFINSTQRIQYCLTNMTVGQYVNATTSIATWKKLEVVQDEMGHIINKLKDENLSSKFDTSMLEGSVKQAGELQFKIEKIFIELSPEEIAAQSPQGDKTKESETPEGQEDQNDQSKQKFQMTSAQLDRQKQIQQCFKLDLRNQALRMCYTSVALRIIMVDLLGQSGLASTSNYGNNFSKKAQLVYARLMDVIFKADHIDADDNGKQYLNMQELVIDKRLGEKYEVMKLLWQEDADAEIVQQKDWNSVLDAVQKDINQLFNDYKFKRLIKQVEESYADRQMQGQNIEQLFFIDRFKSESSPWMEIANQIRADIQNADALKDTIEKLTLKNREQLKVNMTQDRSINTLKVTNTSLEQRLAQTQTKIEELNSVKMDNESLTKKLSSNQQKLETKIKESEALKRNQDELIKKVDELEKKQAQSSLAMEQNAAFMSGQMGSMPSDHAGIIGFRKSKGGLNAPSRASRNSAFFQELRRTSMLWGRRTDATSMTPVNMSAAKGAQMGMNSVELQKQLIIQDEQYSSIISQLQCDRMRLRGQQVTDKIQNMLKQGGALTQYSKMSKDKLETKCKINREEESKLVQAIETVDKLKINAKVQMAKIKVVDLQKKRDQLEQAEQEEKSTQHLALKRLQKQAGGVNDARSQAYLIANETQKTNMNINFMIIQAKEQVNEALKQLMSKDQNLSTFFIDKIEKGLKSDLQFKFQGEKDAPLTGTLPYSKNIMKMYTVAPF